MSVRKPYPHFSQRNSSFSQGNNKKTKLNEHSKNFPNNSINNTDNDPNHWSSTLKCTICMEYFGDPRCLPCGHTFCKSCIENVIDHAKKSKSPVLDRIIKDEKPVTFACPHCRRQMEENNYNKFSSRNIVVESILESWQNSSESYQIKNSKSDSASTSSNSVSTSDFSIQTDLTQNEAKAETDQNRVMDQAQFLYQIQHLGQMMAKNNALGSTDSPTIEDTLYCLQDNLLPGDNFTFGEYQLFTLPNNSPLCDTNTSLIHHLTQVFSN